MESQYLKIIARLRPQGTSESNFRLMDVRTGQYVDFPLGYIHNNIGSNLFAGRCFIPTAVNYPVIWTDDGDRYELPIVEPRTGECYQFDRVIVLFELVKNGELIGYRVTDYAGGFTDITVQDALGYEKVGFFNATVEGGSIKPMGKYRFPRVEA